MGLDAVVFRQLASLRAEYHADLVLADEETGEADLASLRLRDPWAAAVAFHYRFGNIATIGHLREIVADILTDPDSVLQTRVLYSSSHSGDVIEASAFGQIREELDTLRSVDIPEIVKFVAGLDALIM
ncbi:MAG: hypothetical protein E5W60_10135, partial [Mesorhizobium sp.]